MDMAAPLWENRPLFDPLCHIVRAAGTAARPESFTAHRNFHATDPNATN